MIVTFTPPGNYDLFPYLQAMWWKNQKEKQFSFPIPAQLQRYQAVQAERNI